MKRGSLKLICRRIRQGLVVLLWGVLLIIGVLWWQRLTLAGRVIDTLAARAGVEELSYRLSHLTPWRLVLEDLHWGGAEEPWLQVARLDLRYSLSELRRRHLERLQLEGVSMDLLADAGQWHLPLWDKVRELCASLPDSTGDGTGGSGEMPSCGLVACKDIRLVVKRAPQTEALTTIALNGSLQAQEPGQYRLWCQLGGDGALPLKLRLSGTLLPATGAVSLSPHLELADAGRCLAMTRELLPGLMPAGLAVEGSLSVSAQCALSEWLKLHPFKATLSLGRDTDISLPGEAGRLRLQSLRFEVSGTPRELDFQVNGGLSGFELGRTLQVEQERGRLLSLRAHGNYRSDEAGEALNLTLNSDLPGRSLATLLPRLLPLMPAFFSDGGQLLATCGLTRPPGGQWRGQLDYTMAAERSSLPLDNMMLGAGSVRIAGALHLVDGAPERLTLAATLDKGYAFRSGSLLRWGLHSRIEALPPYSRAWGDFRLWLDDPPLPDGLSMNSSRLQLEGETEVNDLFGVPQWQGSLRLPEEKLLWRSGSLHGAALLGARVKVAYGADGLSLAGKGMLSGMTLAPAPPPESDPASEWQLDAEGCEVSFNLPRTPLESIGDGMLEAELSLRGLGADLPVGTLRGLALHLPFTWSLAQGLGLRGPQSLHWRQLQLAGLAVQPGELQVDCREGCLSAHYNLALADSDLQLLLAGELPLAAPAGGRLKLSVPQCDLAADDPLSLLLCQHLGTTGFSARIAAQLESDFPGGKPRFTGKVTLEDALIQHEKASFSGVSASMPFMGGTIFRTIERPFIAFTNATVDKLTFDGGRLDFQVTPRALQAERLRLEFCKGQLHAYAIEWRFADPRGDFVVYADRIDLGQALTMLFPLEGELSGVLYGRQPIGFDKQRLKLFPGYLYSLPQQGGQLRMRDTRQIEELLGNSGIQGEMQKPLAKALSDMDFSTLRFELEPRADGEGTLQIAVAGKSNSKDWPAPVDLKLNLHGPLEQLLSLGLEMQGK